MEVQDGVGVSGVTDMDKIRLRNATASRYNMTGSHKDSERLAYNNSVNNFANGFIFSDMPEDDEMDTEVKRLCSFKNWPASSPIKPKDLAAAGFYCVGRNDQVRCFRCDLTLRKWEQDDVPMAEHKRHRPMCPFVQESEDSEHYQVTCQAVEATGTNNSPKISFKNKEISASQGGNSMSLGFSSSNYPHNYSTTNSGSFDRQEKRYDMPGSWKNLPQEYYPKTSHLKSTREPQLNQETSQTERNNPSYPNQECHTNESLLHTTTSQEFPGKESHLSGQPAPVSVGYYYNQPMARPEKNAGVVEKPVSGYPQQNYPGIPMQSHVPGNTRLELSKETVSYKLTPGSTVQVRDEEGGAKEVYIKEDRRPVSQVAQTEQKLVLQPPNKLYSSSNLKEQEWLKTKSGKIKEESTQYQNPRQMFPHPEVAQFIYQKPQEVTSTTAQGISWHPGPRATQATERVPVGPVSTLPTGNLPPGSLHQGSLYRQEDMRHVSSVAELQSEHHRLTTFVDWPQNSPIHPWELAAAGFYYLGNGDNVECFKCGRGLCNWDPDDTPWGEHLKWSPECPLVIEHFQGRGTKGPVEGTELLSQERPHDNRPLPGGALGFQQTHNLSAPLRLQSTPTGHSGWQQTCLQGNTRNVSTGGSSGANVSVAQRPYSNQSPLSGLVFTFSSPTTITHPSGMGCSESSSSPHSIPQSPVEMGTSPTQQPQSLCLTAEDINRIVEMGFSQAIVEEVISTQLANTGRTFTSVDELTNAVLECGRRDISSPTTSRNSGALTSGMSPTVQSPVSTCPVPMLAEASSSPASYDHTSVAGPYPGEQHKEGLRRTHSAPQATTTAASAPESVEHESLEKKLERMQEERTCKICMDAEIGVVFLPCGHLVCCPNCASGVELCPMCRSRIHENVRTYMS